eukprot:gene22350-34958_t
MKSAASILIIELAVACLSASVTFASPYRYNDRWRMATLMIIGTHLAITGGRRWQLYPAMLSLVVSTAASRFGGTGAGTFVVVAAVALKLVSALLSMVTAVLAVMMQHPTLPRPTADHPSDPPIQMRILYPAVPTDVAEEDEVPYLAY